jgi:hypothetical protein
MASAFGQWPHVPTHPAPWCYQCGVGRVLSSLRLSAIVVVCCCLVNTWAVQAFVTSSASDLGSRVLVVVGPALLRLIATALPKINSDRDSRLGVVVFEWSRRAIILQEVCRQAIEQEPCVHRGINRVKPIQVVQPVRDPEI